MRSSVFFLLAVSAITPSFAANLNPSITAMVNTADSSTPPLAPGSQATIVGSNLASDSANHQGYPLPTALAGVSVTVNGTAARLFLVSGGNVGIQIPYGTAVGNASVIVNNNGSLSNAFQLPVVAAAPGIQSFAGIFNSNGSVNTSKNPAIAGSTISVQFTGGGVSNPAVADGITAASASPLVATGSARVNNVSTGAASLSLSTGTAGGDKADVVLPNGLDNGSYPLSLTVGGATSSSTTVYVAVNAPVIGTPLSMGTVKRGTNQIALSATGGTGTYVWNLVSGALPPGLSLRTDVPSYFPASAQAGLIGVATTAGDYNFRLSVASNGQTVFGDFSLRVSSLALADQNPPDVFTSNQFSYTFTPVGTAGAVSFGTVQASPLPNGVSLSNAGVLSGSVATAGFYPIVMDISNGTDTVRETFTLNVQAIQVISPGVLPNATQGSSYSRQLAGSGGAGGSYVWSLNSGFLPAGLTLSGSGFLGGTITAGPGVYSFQVKATDANGLFYSKWISIGVIGVPTALPRINLSEIDDPVVGNRFTWQASVCCGGTAPFVWTATNLPAGLRIRTGSGITSSYVQPGAVEIVGVAQAAGNFTATLTAIDANGVSTSLDVPIHVAVLDVSAASNSSAGMTSGILGAPYTFTWRVLGGTPPYSVSQPLFGKLPGGLTVTGNAVTAAGTPNENGTFSPVFRFSDSAANTYLRNSSISITLASSNTTINGAGSSGYDLGSVVSGAGYSTQFSAVTTAATLAWSISGGTPPPGIGINSTGLLSGTSNTPGNYTFVVKALDTSNPANVGYREFALTVSPLSIANNASLPFGNIGTNYSLNLTATGSTSSLSWALQNFSLLPPGLTLSTDGTLSGTPTSQGQYSFVMKVTDAGNSATATRTFTLNIYPAGGAPPLFLNTQQSIDTPIGPLHVSLQATGGVPPYHYSTTPGASAIAGFRVADGPPLPIGATYSAAFLGVAPAAGTFSTSIRVTDNAGTTFDRPTTLVVSPVSLLDQLSLPKAVVGAAYSYTFTPSGGSGTYTLSASGVPAGFNFTPATGILNASSASTSGVFNIAVAVKDAAGGPALTYNYSLTVNAFAITTPGVLPQGTVGANYTQPFSAPGCQNCVWNSSALPAGFSLSAGGVLSGLTTSTTGVNTSFTLTAVGTNATASKVFSLLIPPSTIQALSITTVLTATPTVGTPASALLSAAGGTPPYSWSVVGPADTLPPGITLQSQGELIAANFNPGASYLAGRPSQAGLRTFVLMVTDSAHRTTTKGFSWNISKLDLEYPSLPVGNGTLTLGTPLPEGGQPLLVIGGSGNYTSWTTPVSPIYPGLALNQATGVITGTPSNTGSQSQVLSVTDSSGNTLAANFSVSASSTNGTTITLNGPAAGAVFPLGGTTTFAITPNGGVGPYTVSALTPLPSGFALLSGISATTSSASAGSFVLQAYPQIPGTYSFTLQATDANNVIGQRTFNVVVPAFTFPATTTLPDASVSVNYSQQIHVFDSTTPLTFSVAPGSALPNNLSLSTDGLLSGVPTTSGTYTFNLSYSDGTAASASTFQLRVSSLALNSPAVLPNAVSRVPYNYQMLSSGGGPVTWSASNLPSGLTMSAFGVISGTVVNPAPQKNVVSVTATAGGSTISRTFALFTRAPNPWQLSVNQTLNDVVVNSVVNVGFNPAGGVGPYSVNLAPGSDPLPPGLNLVHAAAIPNANPGTMFNLFGMPTTAGVYNFSLRFSDASDAEITRAFSLRVTTVNLAAGNPRNAIVGTPYTAQLTANGGTGPYTFTISPISLGQEMLPAGLAMSASGLISGTANSSGSYISNVTVQDSTGATYTRQIGLLATNPSGLYVNNINYVYLSTGVGTSQTFQTGGGSSTYSWSVVSGSLAPGLSLSTANGVTSFAGQPTAPGTFIYTIRATDNANAANFADHIFTDVVAPVQVVAPASQSITTLVLPAGAVGTPYNQLFRAAGGAPPYTFAQSAFDALPPGLTLNSAGSLSGTPAAAGVYTVRPLVTDSTGIRLVSFAYQLVVTNGNASPLIERPSINLSDASVGQPYVAALDRAIAGGTGPFAWTATGLPPGMFIAQGSGQLSSYLAGTPTTAGTYDVAFNINDAAGQTLTIRGLAEVSPLALIPGAVPNGKVGDPYSVSLVPSGGTGPYIVDSAKSFYDLPAGLTLSPGGLLSGTPTAPGNFVVGLRVTDSADHKLQKLVEFSIDNATNQSRGLSLSPNPISVSAVLGSPVTPVAVSGVSTSTSLSLSAAVLNIPGASLSRTEGNTPFSSNLSFNTSGLAAGTYSGVLAAYSGASANYVNAVPVTLTVAAAPPTCPVTLDISPSASTYRQNVTVTAFITCAGATGQVTFSDGGNPIGTAALIEGAAVISTATFSAGSHSLSAHYAGNATYAASDSTAGVLSVAKAQPTLQLSTSANPTRYGQNVAMTATIAPNVAGSVTFKNGANVLGAVTLNAGAATFTTSALNVGQSSLTAVYDGDANYLPATSPVAIQTVQQEPTSITLTSSRNPAPVGQAVVLTASVSPGAAGGQVLFSDGESSLGSAALVDGVATFTTSGLAAGTHRLSAAYAGNASFSSSNTLRSVPALTFGAGLPETISDSTGAGTGFLARLPGTGGDIPSNDPNLTLNAEAHSLLWRTTSSDINGQVNLANADFLGFPLTSAGVRSSDDFSFSADFMNVQFGGSADQLGLFVGDSGTSLFRGGILSTPGEVAYTAATTGGVDSAVQQSPELAPNVGDEVVFTLSRTAGVWDFSIRNVTTPSKSGHIAITQPTFLNDSSSLVAGVYAGNASNTVVRTQTLKSFSFENALVQQVTQSSSSVTLSSSQPVSGFGENVVFTANVSPSSTTGTVTFRDGETVLGSSDLGGSSPHSDFVSSSLSARAVSPKNLPPSNIVTFSTAGLTPGTHTISAVYGGDAVYTGSTSPVVLQTVNPGATSVSLSTSAASIPVGSSLTLRAVVAPAGATGSVTFSDGDNPLGTVSVTEGAAVFSTASLAVGPHSLRAYYAGNATFAASSSTVIVVSVEKVQPTLQLTSSGSPTQYGQNVVFTANISPTGAGGSITFKDGANTLGTSALNSGVATLSTSTLGVGQHSLTAVYDGNANYQNATSSALVQTINQATTSVTLTTSPASVTVGSPVTLRAVVSPSAATGTVTFNDGDTSLGSATISEGVALLTTSTLPAGSHSLTAHYAGNTTYGASDSSVSSLSVDKAQPTLQLTSSGSPAQYGQNVVFTANISPTGAGGSITFKDGSNTLGTSALTSGVATLSTSTLGVGQHSLTAVYDGNANYLNATSSALVQTINQATTSVTLTTSPASVTVGSPVTLRAVVSPSAATGTVTFNDGDTSLGTATVSEGVALLTTSTLAAGSHSLTAHYAGNTSYAASDSSVSSLSVDKAQPTLQLTSSGSPAQYGQNVVLTANISPTGAGGSITFKDGSNTLGTSALTSGVATFSTSALTVGQHSLTAVYDGNANYLNATSSALVQTINQATTSVTLTTSPASVTVGSPVTLRAVVSPSAATGTVTFNDGDTSLGTATVSEGVALLTTSTLAAGSHSLAAHYAGNTTYGASDSSVSSLSVDKTQPTLQLTSSGSPAQYGQNMVLTANISPTGAGGSITFKDGANTLGTSALTSGVATLSTSALTVGQHSLTAVYDGNANYQNATSSALVQTINQATTSVTLTTSPASVTIGTSVTLRAVVSPSAATGTVTFNDGDTSLGAATVSEGVALLTTSTLAAGSHSLTAHYAGNTTYAASDSSISVLSVGKTQPTIELTSSNNPTRYGQNVVLTATIDPAAAAGSITFKNGANVLGTVVLSAGTATFATTSLGVGERSLTAVYDGNASYLAATSPVLIQNVNKEITSITLTSSANPARLGQSVTLTATVIPSAAGGQVSFSEGKSSFGSAVLVNGVATLTTTALTAGSHNLSAAYAGDENYNSSNTLLSGPSLTFVTGRAGTTPDSNGAGTGFTTRLSGTGAAITANDPNLTLDTEGHRLLWRTTSSDINNQVNLGNADFLGFPLSSAGVNTTEDFSFSADFSNVQFGGSADQMGLFVGDSSANLFRGGILSTPTEVAYTTSTTGGVDSGGQRSPELGPNVGDEVVFTLSRTAGVWDFSLRNVTTPAKSGHIAITQPTFLNGTANLIAGVYATNSLNTIARTQTLQSFSFGGPFVQLVTQTGSTTTLSSSQTTSNFGQNVTFTAAVSPSSSTGTVSFRDGDTVLGSSPLNGGSATFSTAGLTAGTHSIAASYSGDTLLSPSASASLTQTVNKAATGITLSSSASSASVGSPVTLRAVVTPAGATGSVAFRDGTNNLGTVALNGGVATLSTSFTAGSHTLTAIYSGDANNATSSSSPITQGAAFPALIITTSGLPSGQAGQSYSAGLSATGGAGAYSWSGSGFPDGLSVESSGSISGTPTGGFNGSVSVTVNDSVAQSSSSATYSLVITSVPLTVSGPASLGSVAAGSSVSGSFAASGGKAPYTWSISGVPGLSISSAGSVSGTVNTPGTFSAGITVTDSQNASVSRSAGLSVFGITTSGLPSGSTLSDYSASVAVAGGTPPYSFSASGLPPGVSFGGGSFGGRPTAAGSYSVSVRASDSRGLASTASFTIEVKGPGPLSLSSSSLGDAIVGQVYSGGLSASGGTTPYSFSQSGGVLPPGLSLSGSGDVTGTPSGSPGPYSVGVQVTDANGTRVVGTVGITVKPAPLTISTGAFPSGLVGSEYPSQVLTATGGIAPYVFSVRGSLPAGLSLAGGQITGTPTAAGDSSFTLSVTDSSTPPANGILGAGISVRPASPDIVLASGSVSFALMAGSTAAPSANSVGVSSSVVSQNIGFSTSSSVPWLSVSGGSTTPGVVSIGPNSSALALTAAGSPYSGSVTVSCTSSSCAGKSQTIAVSLTVTAAPPQLSLGTNLLSFASLASNPVSSGGSLPIANSGGGLLRVNSVSSDAAWLTIGSSPATVAPGPGGAASFTVDPGGLSAGFYRGTISVSTSGGSGTAAVTLFVSAAATISLGPSGAQFSMPQGGLLGNATGSFSVNVANGGATPFTASTTGSSWLRVTSGAGTATPASGGSVEFSIDPTAAGALTAGAYYGTIRVSASGVVNSPQDFQVILSVTPAAATVVPDPQPAGLVFVSSGTAAIPSQTVNVYASSRTALPFQASASAERGSWLSISPSTGSSSASAPGAVSVTADAKGLTPGAYRGIVSFASGAAVRAVNVTLIVQPSAGAAPLASPVTSALRPQLPSCSNAQLVPTQTGLVSNFSAPTAWPTPISIRLFDTCGSTVSEARIVATFTNGDPPLALTQTNAGQGLYSGTWTPRKASAQVTINAAVTAAGYPSASVQVSGQAKPNAAPILAPNGAGDVFNPLVGGGLGPGNIIQIYGSDLASQKSSPTTLPLPTTMSGTSVLIGGIKSPLFYVSPDQINAQIPFELQPGNQYQLIVSANGALTTPQNLQLNAGTPSILNFTSGAVVAQHLDGSLVLDDAPAVPGEFIVIYSSGLGATDIPVPSGAASPAEPPARVADPPVLTLNGNDVGVLFAGLTPGLVGLYQVNFQVPPATKTGSYDLVLTQSGTASNRTVLAVKEQQ